MRLQLAIYPVLVGVAGCARHLKESSMRLRRNR
jgi:hypothetical protein